jgi:trehalose-6-phosphate synthase
VYVLTGRTPGGCSAEVVYPLQGVVVSGKLVRIGIFPIGTDPQKWQKNCMKAPVIRRIHELREQFNGKKVIIGVDRLDPIVS